MSRKISSILNIDDCVTIKLNAESKYFYTQLCSKLICNANALTSYCNEFDCHNDDTDYIKACLDNAILALTSIVIDSHIDK